MKTYFFIAQSENTYRVYRVDSTWPRGRATFKVLESTQNKAAAVDMCGEFAAEQAYINGTTPTKDMVPSSIQVAAPFQIRDDLDAYVVESR